MDYKWSIVIGSTLMYGLTALIKLGISGPVVRSVNALPISPENQTAFLQKAIKGLVWEDENENGRTCLKVRVLVIRIFYQKNDQLLPLWGDYVTKTQVRQMPFRIANYLKRDADIGEVGADMIFDQFNNGKFSMEKPQFQEESVEINGVPVTRELIEINMVTQKKMGFPIIKRVFS